MNIAVIFAGGTGQRMSNASKPKQFLEVHGKPILIYTLEHFQRHNEIDAIVIVCLESWIDYCRELVALYRLDKVECIIPGGNTGQDSIYNGLKCVKDTYEDSMATVLLHDGVRPMITRDTLSSCIKSVKENGNAITTAPAIETIFKKEDDGTVGTILQRADCVMAKAPQCFVLHEIWEAHNKAREEGKLDFIDSASMMQHYGYQLFTVDGPSDNIKITTPSDFYAFKAFLDANENLQVLGL